jgi:hypothetical protein
MWKKYDRVDLRSDHYKVKKTPERSSTPTRKSPKSQSNILDAQASA